MKFSLFKEIGIILGYLGFLFGIFYFDWDAAGVFMSFIIEYFIILLIYSFLRLHPKVSKRIDEPPLITVMVAGLMLGALNMAFGKILVVDMLPYEVHRMEIGDLRWVISAIALPMLVLHVFSIVSRWPSVNLIDEQRSMIFTGVIALSAMNLAGMIVWFAAKNQNPDVVVLTMVVIRIVFEVWMNHFQKTK